MENKMQDSKREEFRTRYAYLFNHNHGCSFFSDTASESACDCGIIDPILDFIASEVSKARKEILERVALETRANVYDCGDEWKDSDLSVWVESELSKLTTK